jgi:hypothetical protein
MSRKCRDCGAILSIYTLGEVCSPCVHKRQDKNERLLTNSKGNRLDYILDVLSNKGRRVPVLIQPKNKSYF